MRYQALFRATILKILWGTFPFVALFIGCAIKSRFFAEDLPLIADIFLYALGGLACLRVIVELGNHFSELYIDDDIIRFVFFRYMQEIRWSDALTVEIREPVRGKIFAYCLLIVRGKKDVIQYCLSDLAPADQVAIRERVASLPDYNRAR